MSFLVYSFLLLWGHML